jgi:hypothetical protein
MYDVSLEVIQYWVKQWPESIRTTNNGGILPLHIACENTTSLEVIQCLVGLWPESVEHSRDNDGDTPSDVANQQDDYDLVINWLDLQWRNRSETEGSAMRLG